MGMTKREKNWGGRRKGAGRKRSNALRCRCGKHTLAYAVSHRYACAKGFTTSDSSVPNPAESVPSTVRG